ncbi:MAG: prepilin-type N-terminal cleavage/methylation domain-containing protein [Magnetococcales bacterium]|nr:prepilin-type N-terminal cleavage/methylation domain-containing protein [Magnetococcales bacterium]
MYRERGGFSLIELIIFLVVVSVAFAGLVPLYSSVLRSSFLRESVQGRFLADQVLEQMRAEVGELGSTGFDNITSAKYPSQNGIDIGATVTFNRQVTIEGASVVGGSVVCTGAAPTTETYKCVFVQVIKASDGQTLSNQQAYFAK